WPGFGENSRVLKWIFERLSGRAQAVDTPIGRLPTSESLDLLGLSLTDAQLDLLLTVDAEIWTKEAALIPPAYEKFGERLPKALWDEHRALEARLQAELSGKTVAAAE
ncbi:MAG: phosphoenolpyruvate carboxykinase domain-containing protein, partial [Pseudomonadota bacterium]